MKVTHIVVVITVLY